MLETIVLLFLAAGFIGGLYIHGRDIGYTRGYAAGYLKAGEIGLDDLERARLILLDPSNFALRDVARETILSLLNTLEFLGYQLSRAEGLMTEEQFEKEIVPEYMVKSSNGDSELPEKVRLLSIILGAEKLDGEVVSTVFHCGPDRAIEILKEIRLSSKELS